MVVEDICWTQSCGGVVVIACSLRTLVPTYKLPGLKTSMREAETNFAKLCDKSELKVNIILFVANESQNSSVNVTRWKCRYVRKLLRRATRDRNDSKRM